MSNNIYKPVLQTTKTVDETTKNTEKQKTEISIDKSTTNKKEKEIRRSDSDDDLEIKQGCFRKAIPIMPKPLAIVCCIMNIVLPGWGTLVAACSIMCCGTKHGYTKNIFAFLVNFCAFILQFCSSIIIFGWIWSIKYGLLFIRLTDTSPDAPDVETDIPLYCRRHSSVDHSSSLLMYQPARLGTSLVKVQEEDPVS